MVVIHVKRTDRDQFLFETTCAESNDALIRKLVRPLGAAAPATGVVGFVALTAPFSRTPFLGPCRRWRSGTCVSCSRG